MPAGILPSHYADSRFKDKNNGHILAGDLIDNNKLKYKLDQNIN